MLKFKRKSPVLIHVKQNELKTLRIKLHTEQDGVCPILKKPFHESEMVVDHQHKTKTEELGKNGAGMIRGAIHRQANTIEGKFVNAFRRYGLHKHIDEPTFLRNLADYLERKPTNYVHPLEVPRLVQKLQLSSYKQLVRRLREIGFKGKIPPYPIRSKKLTAPLKVLFSKVGITPIFYK